MTSVCCGAEPSVLYPGVCSECGEHTDFYSDECSSCGLPFTRDNQAVGDEPDAICAECYSVLHAHQHELIKEAQQ